MNLILFALVIAGLLWLTPRLPVGKGIAKYTLMVLLAVVIAILLNNWTTTFHTVAE